MAETTSRRRLPAPLAWGLLLAALAILLSLGTWQVQRLYWKEGLIAARKAQMQLAPIDVEALDNARTATHDPKDPPFSVEFHPVKARGTFDHARELYFLATLDGRPGFNVYVPFRLESGRTIIVNRGFVPSEFRNPASREDSATEGVTTLTGLAREGLYEKPGMFVPDNTPDSRLFFWKDIRAMTMAAGLDPAATLPFFIDAGPNPAGAPEWPKGGITIIDLPNNHLQYAVTWYGLAAALVVVTLVFRFRRKAGAPGGKGMS